MNYETGEFVLDYGDVNLEPNVPLHKQRRPARGRGEYGLAPGGGCQSGDWRSQGGGQTMRCSLTTSPVSSAMGPWATMAPRSMM